MKKIIMILFTLMLLTPSAKPVAGATSFPDVNANFWSYNEINYLVDQQIIRGYKDGRFGPNDSIKRLQAAEMLVKALGLSTENRPNPNFKDIQPGDYGYELAATVADEGIITGSNGYFNPWKPLTRGQMAKILGEAYGLQYVFDAEFTDVATDNWAFDYVSALLGNAITTGYEDNTYRPNLNLNRAQFATFMARILDESFKPTIFYGQDAEYYWDEDDTLNITLTVYNNYSYTVKDIKSDISIVSADEVIAEAYFELGSTFELKPKETKVITLTFQPEYVYNVVDFTTYEVYANSKVSK